MKSIISAIKSVYPVSDRSIERLTSSFTRHYLPKRSEIIRGGRFDPHIYFIEKGITRSYCIIDGKEVTTWFSREGDITFGLLDLYRGEAGFEYVETLESSILYSITIERMNEIYSEDIDIANWSRVVHQECVLSLQSNRIDVISLSAKERHSELLKRHPDIYSRVNLGYIASFLGITLPTLSKIRAEI